MVWFYLYKVPKVVKVIETKNIISANQGLGEKGGGKESSFLIFTEFLFCKMRKFQRSVTQQYDYT